VTLATPACIHSELGRKQQNAADSKTHEHEFKYIEYLMLIVVAPTVAGP